MKINTKTCIRVGITAFLLYLCIHYWPSVSGFLGAIVGAASPLIIGCVIAYILNILMSLYERRFFPSAKGKIMQKCRRPVCLLLSAITLIAVVVLVAVLIVPQLASCFKLLFSVLPGALDSLVDWLEKFHLLPEDIIEFLDSIDWKSKISQIIGVLTSGLGDVVNVVVNVVSSVFSGIVTAFLSIIFAVYLLLGKDRIGRQFGMLMRRYMPAKLYGKAVYAVEIFNDCFHRYIVGQCTEAVILGVLCALGMWILRLPYAAMIGALIAFTALIPVAGAYIGGGIGAFMICTVSPVKALIFIIFLILLQQFEGNIIFPRVVGSSMGLPGIWVLAAVTVGGGIMGIPGMLLGVPLAAAVYRILKNDVAKNLPADETPCDAAAGTDSTGGNGASADNDTPSNDTDAGGNGAVGGTPSDDGGADSGQAASGSPAEDDDAGSAAGAAEDVGQAADAVPTDTDEK